ncbi:MAG: CPBP family intramembrane metalloprotease, partial [Leptospiraceae bacterium]|nr:CPBP family intramembrane metalloprotease [Leptospiraceae bacterium]
YLGDYKSMSAHLAALGAFYGVGSAYAYKSDYIEPEEREVKFDIYDATLGYLLQRNGSVYTDIPLVSETRWDRNLRLWKEGQLAEVNTFMKYGPYTRSSRSTLISDSMGNPILSTVMYSIYSSYRDAGGLGEYKKSESILDLAYSPFNPQILKSPLVFAPLILLASVFLDNDPNKPILIQKSAKKDGTLVGVSFINGISPAIGEEAFFRGYLNHNLCMAYGPYIGIGLSGTLFMLAHEGNEDAAAGRASRLLGGIYLGLLHVLNGYDIRPTVAVHFWWNFLIGLAEIRRYKADPNWNKTQREVFYMPIQYTFTF